jgi:DNA repair exonuclease SbcCD ATPase subunit
MLIVAVEEMKVAEGAATGLRMIDQVESEITSIDAAVEKGSRMNAVLQVIARLNGELDKDKALSVEQNARYNEHYATYMQTDSGSWKAELDRHTSAQAAIDLHKASVTAYEKAAEEYQKVLVTSADDPQTLEAREAGVLADYNIASVKVAELEGVLKNIGTSEVCPTCGSKIDISSRPSLEADLATWKPRRNRLANELAEIRSSLAALRKSIKEWNEKTSRVKHEHDRLKVDMESRVKNLPDFAPVPERWSCAIAAREAELKRLTEMYATLGATSKRIQETEKKIQDEVAASKFSVAEIAASSPVNITEMQERVKVLRAESAMKVRSKKG